MRLRVQRGGHAHPIVGLLVPRRRERGRLARSLVESRPRWVWLRLGGGRHRRRDSLRRQQRRRHRRHLTRVQPPAASVTYGYSLRYIRLRPPLHTVTGTSLECNLPPPMGGLQTIALWRADWGWATGTLQVRL